VRVGRPAEELIAKATEVAAGLIVLGGKHHSLLSRWIAGSTAVEVVRRSPVPVLVTRAPVGLVTRILVGADATPAAYRAIRVAEEWAEVWNATLRVLHAVELPPLLPEYAGGYDLEELRRSGEAEAANEIWPLIGDRRVERAVEVGTPAVVLNEEVRRWQADLLVVARHDRSWVARATVGSVTERLLDGLATSILVTPAGAVPDASAPQATHRKEAHV
jgi:nucleotide-binding universal stress UspA family protein